MSRKKRGYSSEGEKLIRKAELILRLASHIDKLEQKGHGLWPQFLATHFNL
jgi:hypothetical protein